MELVGDRPRIELFARTSTPGWDTWGNETNKHYNKTVVAFTQKQIFTYTRPQNNLTDDELCFELINKIKKDFSDININTLKYCGMADNINPELQPLADSLNTTNNTII